MNFSSLSGSISVHWLLKSAQSKPSHQIAKNVSNAVLIEGSIIFHSCNGQCET